MRHRDTDTALQGLIERDPRLPLATLLDDHALSRWLTDAGGGAVQARSRYVRYKPGASCVVLAQVTDGGDSRDVVVGGTAAAGRAKVAKALARARSDEVVAAEPEAGLVALLPSADRHLPALRRLLHEPEPTVDRLLGRPVGVDAVTALAYKPHRRWVGRARLADGSSLLVRSYRSGESQGQLRVLGALPAGVMVPRILGHDRDRSIAALTWSPGTVLDDWLAATAPPVSSMLAEHLIATGRTLALLHGAPPAAAPARSVGIGALGRAAAAVRVVRPDLGCSAARLAAAIADGLTTGPSVLLHGDFSLDQVVATRTGPVLLDLDRAGSGPAAADLGSLVAALMTDPVRAGLAAAVLDALREGYAQIAPPPPVAAVHAWAAAGLLARSVEPFRSCAPGWPAAVDRLLRLAREVLDHGLDSRVGAA